MSRINPKKLFLANALHLTCLEKIMFAQQHWWSPHGFIRAINYHSTPPETTASLEQQFCFYERNYSAVSLEDLKRFFDTRHWFKPKPGLIISFDDGIYNNYSVAAPLLEKYGFVGWFFIAPEFCDVVPNRQVDFAGEHEIYKADALEDGRLALTWDEVKELALHNVIGSHTRSHCRFWSTVDNERMISEIVESKCMIEKRLNNNIEVFCWVGGESGTYSVQAMRTIKQAGYNFAFTTLSHLLRPKTHPLMLGRTNIESCWPVKVVKFQLSGIMDLLYLRKRHQVYSRLRKGLEG